MSKQLNIPQGPPPKQAEDTCTMLRDSKVTKRKARAGISHSNDPSAVQRALQSACFQAGAKPVPERTASSAGRGQGARGAAGQHGLPSSPGSGHITAASKQQATWWGLCPSELANLTLSVCTLTPRRLHQIMSLPVLQSAPGQGCASYCASSSGQRLRAPRARSVVV